MVKITTLDEYQNAALRTAPRDEKAYNIPEEIGEALRDYVGDADGADWTIKQKVLKKLDQLIWTCGLTGEAGEFSDMMKKHHGHGHPLDREKALKELGDVMWYVAVLAKSLDATLSEIAQKNVDKLLKRYPDGFDMEKSKNRIE